MIHRPVDASGDILPVLSSGDLLRGAEAVAQLVRERLELYAGDWWENSDWGNEVLQMRRTPNNIFDMKERALPVLLR